MLKLRGGSGERYIYTSRSRHSDTHFARYPQLQCHLDLQLQAALEAHNVFGPQALQEPDLLLVALPASAKVHAEGLVLDVVSPDPHA